MTEEKIETSMNNLCLSEGYDIILYTVENLVNPDFKIFLPRLPDFLAVIAKELKVEIDSSRLKILPDDTIDLKDNLSIQDMVMLKAVLTFLGSINLKNDFTQFTADIHSNIPDNAYIEKNESLIKHLFLNLDIIFSEFKMKDLRLFTKAIEDIGIPISHTDLYIDIKKYVMNRNKLLLIVAPSGNFWTKSDKDSLNGKQYDKKLNNFNNIYYFWYFVRSFYQKVANHPRCVVGIISSMVSKNLKPCIEFISVDVGQSFTKFLLFEQHTHDNTAKDNSKPVFVRNLEKIIGTCKSNQEWVFNETNLVILESEADKMGKTEINSIKFSCFDEDYFFLTLEKQAEVREKVDRLIEYLIKMLEECETDTREYLTKNPLENN
jgi:hypothetical protein